MGIDLTRVFACPRCHTDLPDPSLCPGNGHECPGCKTCFPLVRGVPRFVESDAYASSFSFEWNRHRLTELDTVDSHESGRTFREKTGFTPDDIKNKLVLDVRCGMGRAVRKRVESDFSLERAVDRLVALYFEVFKDRGRRTPDG